MVSSVVFLQNAMPSLLRELADCCMIHHAFCHVTVNVDSIHSFHPSSLQ